MRVYLYLIRHGETVDNVAGLYAGVRDSALTNHGHDQACRLGDYFAKNEVKLTQIFASPLTRASKTAELIRESQAKVHSRRIGEKPNPIDIVKVPDLIEQDFGFYEGKPFHVRSTQNKTEREEHLEKSRTESEFIDVESKESMGQRADAFLDQHLLPELDNSCDDSDLVIGIVSHGMLLSTLWRRLLLRLPRKSLTVAPEVTAARGALVLEHLGGWSNTGYLELAMSKDIDSEQHLATPNDSTLEVGESTTTACPTSAMRPSMSLATSAAGMPKDEPALSDALPRSPRSRMLHGWSTHIVAVDSKQHLVGLKRQRGGIGRLAHDEGQKKLDGFFKKQKTG
nr:putative phosphatase [Quercus suber]